MTTPQPIRREAVAMVSELQHFPVHQLQSKGEEARKGPSPCSSTLHPGASTAEPGRAPGKAGRAPCTLLPPLSPIMLPAWGVGAAEIGGGDSTGMALGTELPVPPPPATRWPQGPGQSGLIVFSLKQSWEWWLQQSPSPVDIAPAC